MKNRFFWKDGYEGSVQGGYYFRAFDLVKFFKKLENNDFVPKWRYDNLADAARLDYERRDLEVSVNVNGERYKVI